MPMNRAGKLLELARARHALITTAESCTGGMISAAITDPPGASDIFQVGFVTYSNTAKTRQLGVEKETLDRFGAVSEPVAVEMAEGALTRSGATHAIAVTGIAGPGGSDHKPEGRVCFALACKDDATVSETVEFSAVGRAKVRQATVEHALDLLIAALAR